jgi:hypothetical protein
MATAIDLRAFVLEVTQEDIDKALAYRREHTREHAPGLVGLPWEESSTHCPIYQALTRLGLENVHCNDANEIYWAQPHGRRLRYRVSAAGEKIMGDYDNGNAVEPAMVDVTRYVYED